MRPESGLECIVFAIFTWQRTLRGRPGGRAAPGRRALDRASEEILGRCVELFLDLKDPVDGTNKTVKVRLWPCLSNKCFKVFPLASEAEPVRGRPGGRAAPGRRTLDRPPGKTL